MRGLFLIGIRQLQHATLESTGDRNSEWFLPVFWPCSFPLAFDRIVMPLTSADAGILLAELVLVQTLMV